MLMLIVAAFFIAIASSTREGRAVARQALSRFNPALWLAVGVIWAILLTG